MLELGIIIGSTRPGRIGAQVGRWVLEVAAKRSDAKARLIDLADYDLPLLDEPLPPSTGKYSKPHTLKWSQTIAGLDAFVFVTPEYNHGIPGALKNAIDFLYREWNDKACGFVSYGGAMGVRSVEQLRLVMAELQVADVRAQLLLSTARDFENHTTFKPTPSHEKFLGTLLDQVVSWGEALRGVREKKGTAPSRA